MLAVARVCRMDTAARVASEPSSATSSWEKGRGDRLDANSTPTNCPSTSSGVPQIATRPSSPTAVSIAPVCANRWSAK